ncbi:MAG: type II toxin-antitoxin system RelE/ParE family toxin [Proteobacteria bacterium]|nr:type II toxin-antitoxin system RelE/ParE family toxin [Pseudomonadota bacterium]
MGGRIRAAPAGIPSRRDRITFLGRRIRRTQPRLKVRFLTPAREELRRAVSALNDQREGLGTEFLQEVRSATLRIEQLPHPWPRLSENTRRCRTHRFEYGLIYEVIGEEIIIVAVAHLHRQPDYWRSRTK